MPLHYRILIAMVLGALVGGLVNPGDVSLPDETVQRETPRGTVTVDVTERRARIVEDDERITILYTRNEDRHAPAGARDGSMSDDFPGNDRSRREPPSADGRLQVDSYTAKTARELDRKYPQWRSLYAEHGGGFPAMVTIAASYLGNLFLKLLKMITVPLIVTSLVTGIAGLGQTSRFGAMFGRTLLYYLGTSLLAITTGLALVNVVRPGIGALLPGTENAEVELEGQSLPAVFVVLVEGMIPANPVAALARGDFLAIILFSILVGIFILKTGGRSGEVLREFFQAAFDVMLKMTMAVIALAPIGVFAFMVFATASQGLEIFGTLAWYMLTVFLALVVHAGIVLPLIVKFVARRSPWEYFRALSPALMTAFSTASSSGTLPLTMTCVEERAGVSNRISSFVLPLGATINMDGTALYEVVAVLFIAQASAFANPDFQFTAAVQIKVAFTALLASVGAAGIPQAGLVMMAIVLQAAGLPLEAQGIILAVDRVLDMCRTSVNVWSDSCGCAVVDRFEPDERAA